MYEHPITPPPELVEQWINEEQGVFAEHIATQAARWGADQELEACREEIIDGAGSLYVDDSELRVCLADDISIARRPKPLSLKEQALEALDRMDQFPTAKDQSIIRRALESLPD